MIKIETFCDSQENSNTYLITCDGYAIIIDPSNSVKTMSRFIGENKVLGILLTHGHYDHFKTLAKVMDLYNVKCYLHKNAIKKLYDKNASCEILFGVNDTTSKINKECLIPLNGEEPFILGPFNIRVMHTPGHTNCSVIYFIEDAMFTGDTLFRNSVGRTDLGTGSMMALNESLNRIKRINKQHTIYPGHDFKTTLFDEIKYNPYLK